MRVGFSIASLSQQPFVGHYRHLNGLAPALASDSIQFSASQASQHRRIAIVTDYRWPAATGVNAQLEGLMDYFGDHNIGAMILSPQDFFGDLPPAVAPNLPIRFRTMGVQNALTEKLDTFAPDGLLIMTEFQLGAMARRYALKRGIPFATSYTTDWISLFQNRQPFQLLPNRLVNWGVKRYLQWFHGGASKIHVYSNASKGFLTRLGLNGNRVVNVGTGVEKSNFYSPKRRDINILSRFGLDPDQYPRPYTLYLGRLDPEKNVADFLDLDLPGTKIVVGPGSLSDAFKQQYGDPNTQTVFLGKQTGDTKADIYASSDVFVFPCANDTLGIVQMEALLSGLPVVAYDLNGSKDIIQDQDNGYLISFSPNRPLRLSQLEAGVRAAITMSQDRNKRQAIAQQAHKEFDWNHIAPHYLNNIPFISPGTPGLA